MNNDNSAKIILCDDEAIILKAVEIAIKKVYSKNNKKVFIETSSNGIECLYKIYHDYRFKGIKYDLLIIDENMDYLKGSQVTSILKGLVEVKQLNELRIFSATGHEDEISLNRIKKFGCDGFIGKPIKATDITSTLTQLNLI